MKKSLIPFAFLSVMCFAPALAQKQADYTCYFYDNEADETGLEAFAMDANTNCLEITGATSEKTLKQIFVHVPDKDKIQRIELNAYTGKRIPAAIKSFTNLRQLSVVSSPDINYKALFATLHDIKNLITLELDDNGSAPIPSNIKGIENLISLTITNYDVVDADKLFEALTWIPALQSLTLASNGYIKMEKDCAFPKSLTSLDLSDNWLSYLPDGIAKTSQLHAIDITENNFTDADPVVRLLENLPLQSIKVNCHDKRDSLIFMKTFPALDLQIAIYHEVDNPNYIKKNNKIEAMPAITNIYRNVVKPRVGDPEIVRKKYTIENNQATTLNYYSGTEIHIPEAAFVDSAGKAVTDNVDIYYREFKDIVDIFASGVPMGYDSAGQKYPFRTGGMFEMYAFNGNQPVMLAPGKKIGFDFAVVDTAKGFNLYRLNQNTGNWNFNGPLAGNKVSGKNKFSEAYRLYNRLWRTNIDTTSFADRYADSTYARTWKVSPSIFARKKGWPEPNFRVKRVFKYSNVKEIRKLPNFILDIKSYPEYKELTVYRGYVWAYAGNLSRKDFQKKYVSRKKWADARVSYLPADNKFIIELKSPFEVVTMEAYPIKPNFTTDTKQYEKTYVRLDNRYNKALKKVGEKFNKDNKESYTHEQSFNWKLIISVMSPAEKAMSRDEWLAYARKRMAMEKDSIDRLAFTYDNFTRSFEIDGFGIWNCDQIMRLKQPIEILATFTDAFHNGIKTAEINVIDANIKSILSYNVSLNGAKIFLDPNTETAMFIIKENGEFAIIDKKTVKTTINPNDIKSDYTFTAYEVDPLLLSTGELRKKLGLE